MFGLKKLKNRVDELERIEKNRRAREDCANGRHSWILRDENTSTPFVRCRDCYKVAENNK